MIQLIYVSSAARPMTAAQLLVILQQCYGHNPLHGITGLLLYGNGTFLQTLEGDDAVVAALYEKIERDTRHAHVKCLSRKPIETRLYPGWSMGFRRLSEVRWDDSEGLRRFGRDDFTAKTLAGDVTARDALLRHFGPGLPRSSRDALDKHGSNPSAQGKASGTEGDATEREMRQLREALRRAEGGIEIARLVLEDIAEAHASQSFGDAQGKLCRFALGQINGI